MQTINRRARPHSTRPTASAACSGSESAAMAFTARLLGGFTAEDAEPILLIPGRAPRATNAGLFCLSDDDNSYFDRAHGKPGAPWYGMQGMVDMLGRVWKRSYSAVIDDFGSLVEVAR